MGTSPASLESETIQFLAGEYRGTARHGRHAHTQLLHGSESSFTHGFSMKLLLRRFRSSSSSSASLPVDVEGVPNKGHRDDHGNRKDEPGPGFRSSPVVDLAELLAKRQHHSLIDKEDKHECETDYDDDSDCSTVAISNLSFVETDAVVRTNVSEEESSVTQEMGYTTATEDIVTTNTSVPQSSWGWEYFCGLHAPVIYCMTDE